MTLLIAGGVGARTGSNRPSRARATRRWRDRLARFAFLVPAVVYVLVFFGYPLAHNISISLRDYTVRSFFTGEAPLVGFANYGTVFDDLALAVFFADRFPGGNLLRALLLLPWLLPLVVSGAVWRWMLDADHGVVNEALRALHLTTGATPWLTSTHWALPAVIIANIWIGIPFNLVILHGGLTAVPVTLYEAAALDGAGRWRRFRHVTWPLLRPVTAIVLMLGLVYTIKVFDVIMVITGGGPANATQTLTTWSYQLSFRQYSFGPGAAVGNLLIVLATVFGLVYLRSARTSLAQEAR
jgi:multiple sugar transport system permease protein